MNIKKRFEKLPTKDIVLLYLIVVIMNSLIYIYLDEVSKFFYEKESLTIATTENRRSEKTKVKTLSDLELIEYIHKSSKENKLMSIDIKITESNLQIQGKGSIQNITIFMNKIEENFELKRFEIKYIDDIEFLIIVKKKFFIRSISQKMILKNISNPFIFIKSKKESNSIKIDAIIGLEVLIDDKWYKEKEMINEYRILKIDKHIVYLVDTITNKKINKGIDYE